MLFFAITHKNDNENKLFTTKTLRLIIWHKNYPEISATGARERYHAHHLTKKKVKYISDIR